MSTMEEHEKGENFLPRMDLPLDLITLQIITRLPIKSVLSFKCVSKQWYSTLSSPHFGNTHFKFSPFYHPLSSRHCVFVQYGNNYSFISCEEKGLSKLLDIGFDGPKDETFLVGSCNGLMCLVSLSGCLIIWNPIIHQYAKFELPFASFEVGNESIAWGFGYASSFDDYKVVRLVETVQPNEIICHVFSLRTKKWEQIHDPRLSNCSFARARAKRLVGVLVNETLYWIVDKQNGGYGQDILGFDLALERFYKMKCLYPGDTYLSEISFLCVMGGYLSMCRFTNRGDVSISILKQHGQVEYIGLYRDLDLSSCSALVGFTRAGELFIQLGNQELGLIDLKSSPRKYIRLVTFEGEGKTYISSYVPSLISPLHISD